MARTKERCRHTIDPDAPETWGGGEGDECHVPDRLLDEDGVWTCPHTVADESEYCIFHLPVDEKDPAVVLDELLEALRGNGSVGPDGSAPLEFVNATFGEFTLPESVDLEGREIFFTHSRILGTVDCSRRRIDAECVEFSGAKFEGAVDFSGSDFDCRLDISDAVFSDDVDLSARFGDHLYGSDARFCGLATFWNARFEGRVVAHRAVFEGVADFREARFDRNLDFTDATFEERARFWRADVRSDAEFVDVEFRGECGMTSAKFEASVRFSKSAFEEEANFFDARFADRCDFSRVVFFGDAEFAKSEFHEEVSFAFSTFESTSDFGGAEFEERANFPTTEFQRPAEFRRTNFAKEVDFQSTSAPSSDFSRADLTDADFTSADLRGSNFESTLLSRATLFTADLRGARLHGALLGDVRVNGDTRFLGHPDSVKRSSLSRLSRPCCVYDPDYPEDVPHERDKAKSVYRALEELAGKSALPRLQAEAFVRRQDLQKQSYWAIARDGDGVRKRTSGAARWARARTAELVLLYGESPWRVLAYSAGTILAFGLLFPFGGWLSTVDGRAVTPLTYDRILNEPVLLWKSIYHSAMLFATGNSYGGVVTSNVGGELLTSVEALLGPLLIALLVFVLGRRAAR